MSVAPGSTLVTTNSNLPSRTGVPTTGAAAAASAAGADEPASVPAVVVVDDFELVANIIAMIRTTMPRSQTSLRLKNGFLTLPVGAGGIGGARGGCEGAT